MKIRWARLFRGERAKIKPVLMQDVVAAQAPNKALEIEHDMLALKLLRSGVDAAILSGKIREGVAKQVALSIQGRGGGNVKHANV